MLASIKSFIAFFDGYLYIIRCNFSKLVSLIIKHTGKVETCYGGVQTTLFAGVTFVSFSKHFLNHLDDKDKK